MTETIPAKNPIHCLRESFSRKRTIPPIAASTRPAPLITGKNTALSITPERCRLSLLLIAAETPENVLSDEDLVVLLGRKGVKIARRTVAKYRESMNIPTSAQRKREKRLKKAVF